MNQFYKYTICWKKGNAQDIVTALPLQEFQRFKPSRSFQRGGLVRGSKFNSDIESFNPFESFKSIESLTLRKIEMGPVRHLKSSGRQASGFAREPFPYG
jgi:hypothetical protein